MAAVLPTVVFDAPPVPAQGYGLLAAATVYDTGEVARHLGGVDVYPYNCDTGFGTYSTDLCSDDDPAVKDPGERGAMAHFAPMVVYGASRCATDQTEDEVLARARQTRTLHEPLLIESAFATAALTDAGTPATASSLEEAIGMAEEWLGERGYNGILHAARRFAVEAGRLDAANGSSVLRTNLQNTWAFGGGYASALGNTLLVTGPVYLWRSAPFEQSVTTGSHVTAAFNNDVYALSERVVVAGYECEPYAITISTTP